MEQSAGTVVSVVDVADEIFCDPSLLVDMPVDGTMELQQVTSGIAFQCVRRPQLKVAIGVAKPVYEVASSHLKHTFKYRVVVQREDVTSVDGVVLQRLFKAL